MRRFSRKRRRSGRRRTVGGKIPIPDVLLRAFGRPISSVDKRALQARLNLNQKPSSLKKEAPPEEEEKTLEKAMAQNTIMLPNENKSAEEETTTLNDIELP